VEINLKFLYTASWRAQGTLRLFAFMSRQNPDKLEDILTFGKLKPYRNIILFLTLHPPVFIECTNYFHIKTVRHFCPQNAFITSVRSSQQTVVVSLHHINTLVFVPHASSVYCAVLTQSPNICCFETQPKSSVHFPSCTLQHSASVHTTLSTCQPSTLPHAYFNRPFSGFSLGAFAKLRKATIRFVTSVRSSVCPSVRPSACPPACPSVCPHEITRLPLDGFS
jgi:hypothetical protein